eukprot:CAMPEP_0185210154 /NCGR_PEP_ID=MMETSP1140-20130426/65079_1 /TAXON_ID=298111 /ORGANISM="Pavlova sp., Strain CCMP459" /LENGTH=189 /DNA_ID=CAMNT_0027777951 /DNA_START=34 /DNA_END=600 /DNA_ORIENTATION=-
MDEADPLTRMILQVSFGRWSLQCVGGTDMAYFPNALYRTMGEHLANMFSWPTGEDLEDLALGACGLPLVNLLSQGLLLRLVGCIALVCAHRDKQHKPPICGDTPASAAAKRGGGGKGSQSDASLALPVNAPTSDGRPPATPPPDTAKACARSRSTAVVATRLLADKQSATAVAPRHSALPAPPAPGVAA